MKLPTIPKSYGFALWFAVLTALASIPAYYYMLTGFSFWDDEGTLMISVKRYLGGAKLYAETPLQTWLPYGPVYFFYNWMLRRITATPVTHDVVRVSSMLPMLLTMLLSAWIVFRFTDSLVLASATHLMVLVDLGFFRNEPGHPQELCILLLVGLVAAAVLASIPRWRFWGMTLLGVLPCLLLLVKVNIGVFALLATSLAALALAPRNKLGWLGLIAVATACILLPALLMKAHLGDPRTQFLAILVTASMIAVLLVLLAARRAYCFAFYDWMIAIVAFASTMAAVLFVLALQGVAPIRLLHVLFLDILGAYVIHGSWYVPLPLHLGPPHEVAPGINIYAPGWYVWIVAGLVLAVYWGWNVSRKENPAALFLKLSLALLTVVGFLFPDWPWSEVLRHLLFVLPFCWLILFESAATEVPSHAFPRTLLCTLTVIQTLYTYPIAGSQFRFICVLPIIVIMVFVGDFWRGEGKDWRLSPNLIRTIGATVLLCVAALYLAAGHRRREQYSSLPSMRLPGANRIHVQETQARDYRWLAQEVNTHCDVFLGFPGFPSLYLWTGKDPLPGMDVDNWMLTASDEQQFAVSKILSEHSNACEVYNPDLVSFWRRDQNLSALPLLAYLNENFKVARTMDSFSLLVRKERNLVPASRPKEAPFDGPTTLAFDRNRLDFEH